MRIKSAVFSSSFLLAVSWASAQSIVDVAPEVRAAKSPIEAANALRQSPELASDDSLQRLVAKAEAHPDSTGVLQEIVRAVDLRARVEEAPTGDSAATAIRQIQSNPLYRNVDERRNSNWLGDTLSKIQSLIPKVKKPEMKEPTLPQFSIGDAIFKVLAWIVLGALLIFFLYYALRYWSFKRSLQRRAAAVLEEDEPERTVDEWLAMADSLEREGRFREAIRCLYLACLLKFDEAGVARFVRSHTNWEHLERIQASSKNPGIDFLPLTKAFDLAWYGFRAKSAEDVASFREGYMDVTARLRSVA